MAISDVQQALKREGQLNAIAYTIIVLLLGIILALIVPWITDVEVPEIAVLSNQLARTLFFGLLFMFILYLVDQHRKLRGELLATHDRLELAHVEISSAYERLSFAQHTASVMTSLTEPNALERVLGDATKHFGADAAAVVGEEVTLIARPEVDASSAESAVLQVALDVVRAGKAMATKEHSQGGEAIAVPLRMRGELKSVVCLWRQGDAFPTDQLEGLILMARIIELSLENRKLLEEVEERLSSTLSVLSALINKRLPDDDGNATSMARHAMEVGRTIGLNLKELTDLRIAALLADIGMLHEPDEVERRGSRLAARELERTRMHPTTGAEVARAARFNVQVQEAIRSHHERLDGSGFPDGRTGESIPVAARILAVCAEYDSMTSPRRGRPRYTQADSMAALTRGAGILYDAEVVRAFMQVVGQNVSVIAQPRVAQTAQITSSGPEDQPLKMVM